MPRHRLPVAATNIVIPAKAGISRRCAHTSPEEASLRWHDGCLKRNVG